MRTDFTVSRIKDSPLSYTVLLRTASLGAVDVSLWLTDAEARDLALQLFAACQPTPSDAPATPATPATTTEAA